jgi:solute carrier family 25 protein 42
MDSFHRGFERLVLWADNVSPGIQIYETIICGAMAGIIAKTAVAPAERVKMTFQVTSSRFTLNAAWNKAIEIVYKEGFFKLWKGHSTTIVRVAPYSGLSYAFHDFSEKQFKYYLNVDRLPLLYKFIAGSIGGATGTLLTYPLDVLRVRIALIPNSSWNSAIKQGGLFQGLFPTIMGIVPYAGTCWMVKQTLHEYVPNMIGRKTTVFENLSLNSCAGLSAQFVTYPLDIVRRRMQLVVLNSGEEKPSILKLIKELIAKEGVRGLTKGFSLNIIKGPITLSLSLTTYDMMMDYLKQIHKIHG